MRRSLYVCALALAVACAGTTPSSTPTPTPPPAAPPAPAPTPPTPLESLLEAIDPGTLPALTTVAPAWWVKATKTVGGTPAEVATIILNERAFKLGADDVNHFDGGLKLLTAVVFLERHREAGDCDATCERGIVHVYEIFSFWSFMTTDAIAKRAITVSGLALGKHEQELSDFFVQLLAESPRRFRAAAVALIRRSVDSAEATATLRAIANVEARLGNYAIADNAFAEVVRRLGKDVGPTDLIEAARKSFQAGNITRGHDFVTRAEPLSPDTARDLAQREAWATYAARLAQATDYEERVRLDELGMRLERHEEVRRLSAALMEEHPEDARPFLYYGRSLFDTLDLPAADAVMRRAGPEHRDIDFYQFTIGVRCAVGMHAATVSGGADAFVQYMRTDLAGLRQLTAEYMKLEPSRADWIAMALDFAEAGLLDPSADAKERSARMHAAVDSARTRATADDAKWPEGGYYARVRLVCAMLDNDTKRSRDTIADVLGAHLDDDTLAPLLRSVVTIRALMWRDQAALDALLKTLQPSTKRADRQFVLEMTAVRTDIKNTTAWDTLATAYQAIGAPDDDAEKKRYINNLGVMRYRSNRKAEAHDLWFASGNAGTEYPAALLNLYATEEGERDTLWQALQYRMGVDDHLDHVAKVWTIHFTAKDKAAAKKELKALAKSETPPMFTPYSTPNVAVEKALKIAIGFGQRLETTLNLEARPWLIVEP